MKNFLFLIILLPFCLVSKAVQIGDLNYVLDTSDMTAEASSYLGYGIETVIVPPFVEYEGKKYIVTSIGDKCFYNKSRSVKKVELSNNITSIGKEAFAYCESITDLTISNSVLNFGSLAFFRCENLKNITLNINDLNSYIETGWVVGNDFIHSLSFNTEDSFTIDYKYKNESIKNLTIPMGISSIAEEVFYNGINIKSIAFPDGTKEISASAFKGTGVISVQLPASLEVIGEAAFKNCTSLFSISFPEKIQGIGKAAFEGCSALYEVSLPASIAHLSENIFKDCSDLEVINFPSGLIEIGDAAFRGCRLSSITLPDSVEILGNEAFYGNPLKEFKFSSNIKRIGDRALYDCGITFNKLSFNEGLISIGSEVFHGHFDTNLAAWPLRSNIKNISLPSTLEFIGSQAFAGSTFTEVTIPASMTKITDGAFSSCYYLTVVNFHDNITEIGDEAFQNSGITNITLPETIKSIGSKAFNNSSLLSFTIPNSVTYIGECAFSNLHYLKIGTGFNDFNVKFCEFTDVLELIEATPPALTANRLGFNPKMVLVPEGAGEAYKSNNRWKDYNIVAKNSGRAVVYLTEPGTLATEIRLQSGLMPGAVTNLSIEGPLNKDDFAIMRSNMEACYEIDLSRAQITEIPVEAFKDKVGLLELVLPNSITTIGHYAFENCYLMRTNIPKSLVSIGEKAFSHCESMDNEIIFPPTILNVGNIAFSYCKNIKSVDMSLVNNITLGTAAFYYCTGLLNVILPSELTDIPSEAFYRTNITSIEIPASASIGSNAFYGCSSLREVVLNPGISSIGENAFANSGLQYISIPSTVKSIPSNCFKGSDIMYANVEGAIKIGEKAFAECSNLLVVNLPSTLESVKMYALNSASLSAINSPSLQPAETSGNPFSDVSSVSCALSIPKPSFSSYLSAEYWGKFVNIRNCIDITEESIDANGNAIPSNEDTGIELTYMDEEDYQEMLEDIEENETEPTHARRKALRIMRVKGFADVNRGYGKLFNNASLFLDENVSTRFFISLADDVKSFSVTYNGKDITNQVDLNTMSFVINGLKSNGSLIISTKGHVNGIENIISDKNIEDDENAPYYNLNGMIVKNPTPGIYIRGGKKVIVR